MDEQDNMTKNDQSASSVSLDKETGSNGSAAAQTKITGTGNNPGNANSYGSNGQNNFGDIGGSNGNAGNGAGYATGGNSYGSGPGYGNTNRPLRSFGSNQVDLGGINRCASATSKS